MKKLFSKTFIAGIIALFVGFGSVFGTQGLIRALNPNVNVEEEPTQQESQITHQRMLLDNLLKMGTFEVDGGIDFTLENKAMLNVDVNAVGDISNLNNIKLQGDVNLFLNGINLSTNIAYFKDENSTDENDKGTIYFSYKENNFYLDTNHLLDFIDMLPTEYGVQVALPEELSSLDLNTLSTMIDGMEEHESTNGDIFFILNLSEDIKLYVKTDADYNFKGVRSDEIIYKGTSIKLDFDLNKVEDVEFVIPNKENYQNFKPIFNIFKSLYNFFTTKQNTVNISANVMKKNEEVYEEFVNASLDFGYDIDINSYQLEATIKENERSHKVDMVFEDKTAYLDILSTKISIKFESIIDTVKYVLEQLNVNVTEKIGDLVVEILNSDKFASMREGLNDLVGAIQISENEFSIELDLDALGLNMGVITPVIRFNENSLESISVSGLVIKDYKVDVSLSLKDYVRRVINKDEYVACEPALTLVEAILPLINQKDFRIEFDAKVESTDANVKDVTIDGGLQFNISEQGFGYGQVRIVDRDSYNHVIKADMKSKDEFLFSYNDTFNGKFSSKTLKEMYGLVNDIINNPDDHFYELFGDLLNKFKNTPIGAIINGDYLAILDTDIINSISIDETSIKMNISLAIIGMDDKSMDLEIDYHYDDAQDKSFLDGLKISNLEFEGNIISFNAYLKEFDPAKENERLDAYQSYIDFSDIKVLLQLGVNTSKFEYFHFSAKLDIDLPLFSLFDKELTLDIQIRNDKGKVQVAAEIYDIPTIGIINGNSEHELSTDGRRASIYFDKDILYLKRVDKYHTGLFNKKYYEITYGATYETDYFLDNIAEILTQDLFGINDFWYETLIKGSSTSSSEGQIEYEKILKDFKYNADAGRFDFVIDLNALTHVSVLQTLDLTVFEDKDTEQLTGLNISLPIHLLSTTIGVDLKLTTVSKDTTLNESNELTAMNEWVASRSGAIHNSFVKISDVRI